MAYREKPERRADPDQLEAVIRLGQWVRQRREELGLSQDVVTGELGKAQRWLSRIELGQNLTLPTRADLRALAAVLDCTPADLLAAAGYLDQEPAEIPEADDVAVFTSIIRDVNRLRGVSAHDKAVIQTVVDYVRAQNEDEP